VGVETPERPAASAPERAGAEVGRALWHLLQAIAVALVHAARRLRRWNRRGGAGTSGLAGLIELHAVQSAADACVTVALAGHLFFEVPSGQARSRVAIYLLVTMAPFAVVAPVLGPMLDRFRHGRRFALAATTVARAVLALVIGHNLGGGMSALALYPAALGVLVAGKAYSIVRSAAVPRLMPTGLSLVQANARLTFAGVVAPGIAGVFAIGLTKAFGHMTTLRFSAALYVLATLLALRLPRRADGGADTRANENAAGHGLLRLSHVHQDVRLTLRWTMALRALAGFLLLYGAFVVRTHPIGGLSQSVSLAALAVGLGVGNLIGTTTGTRAARINPQRLGLPLLLVSLATTLLTAIDFSLFSVFAVAVVTSAAVAVAKLALDATIQQRVDDDVRTSTFARSETALQLAWVAGGALGIVLPTHPWIGFLVATIGLAAAVVDTMAAGRRRASPATAR
jgi:MFS family permease